MSVVHDLHRTFPLPCLVSASLPPDRGSLHANRVSLIHKHPRMNVQPIYPAATSHRFPRCCSSYLSGRSPDKKITPVLAVEGDGLWLVAEKCCVVRGWGERCGGVVAVACACGAGYPSNKAANKLPVHVTRQDVICMTSSANESDRFTCGLRTRGNQLGLPCV